MENEKYAAIAALGLLLSTIAIAPIGQVKAEGGNTASSIEWSGHSTIGVLTKLGEAGGITKDGYKLQFRDYCSQEDTTCYFSISGIDKWVKY